MSRYVRNTNLCRGMFETRTCVAVFSKHEPVSLVSWVKVVATGLFSDIHYRGLDVCLCVTSALRACIYPCAHIIFQLWYLLVSFTHTPTFFFFFFWRSNDKNWHVLGWLGTMRIAQNVHVLKQLLMGCACVQCHHSYY